MAAMDAAAFLIAVAAAGFGGIALLGLGWLIERPLDHHVHTWVQQLRTQGGESERKSPRRPGGRESTVGE